MKDKNYYNNESEIYSAKRYPPLATNYVQFFFKKRLDIVAVLVGKIASNKIGLNIFEIGCADGIVLKKILEKFRNNFTEMIGVDNSEGMIKKAKASSPERIQYFLRNTEPTNKKFNIILEVGVANYADIDEELIYAKNFLADDGIYIISLAGKDSINARFGQGTGYNNFLSYQEYEEKIRKTFDIAEIIPVGFYVPLIWRLPVMARQLQILLENVFRLWPNLFHEKIYLLKLKK